MSFSAWCWAQLDIDIGSSSVANGVVGLVLGYLSKLTVDMAFLIQVSHTPNAFLPVACVSQCRTESTFFVDRTKNKCRSA